MRAGFPVKINCSVLIYKTNKAFLTLHVYLIPCDPGLQEVIAYLTHYIDLDFKTQKTMLAAVPFKLLAENVFFPTGNKKQGINQWTQNDPKAIPEGVPENARAFHPHSRCGQCRDLP